ncbi:MAG TPA: Dabb family protein [Chryseolinea sp.]
MAQSQSSRVRHSVIFKLKHAKGSAEEQEFFNAAKKLAAIPGVEKFECLKQTSKKNKFEFGISMEFASQQLYDQYNNHPEHTAFVQQRWMKDVEDFMEIDFEVIR